MKTYYDDRIESVARYRVDPPSLLSSFTSQSDGWGQIWNSITGLRLSVTDAAIEVRGFGPFRRLIEAFGGMKLSLPTDETAMSTVRMGRIGIGPWRTPWRQGEYIALSCKLPNDVEYALAIRPADGDYARLKNALKSAGVSDS